MKLELSKIEVFAQTNVGKVRKNNEDALLVIPQAQCFVVSDGMGGGKAGEVASALMVKEIETVFKKAVQIPAEREGLVIRSAYKVNETKRASSRECWYENRPYT